MSYVAINVLTVPEGRGEALEARFAGRAGAVESAPGFERFALLRPVEGHDRYLVYTQWRSRGDFEAWRSSESFGRDHGGSGPPAQGGGPERGEGHGGAAAGAPSDGPAASGAELWGFEVVQEAGPAGG
jgi:heme oxygenase (mycobilin-producing)